jgi:hypothetical protein
MLGHIRPHHTIERDLAVPPRLIRRHDLQTGDRVKLDLRNGRPRRILIYSRRS